MNLPFANVKHFLKIMYLYFILRECGISQFTLHEKLFTQKGFITISS